MDHSTNLIQSLLDRLQELDVEKRLIVRKIEFIQSNCQHRWVKTGEERDRYEGRSYENYRCELCLKEGSRRI